MAYDPENPHNWFTAGEVAEVAKAHGIGEVPTTKSGMIKRLKSLAAQHPEGFAVELETHSRKRKGQRGGGGTEYYWFVFCDFGPQISDALVAEITKRGRSRWSLLDKPHEWFTAEDIASMAHVHELDEVPRFKTYVLRWMAERKRRRPKTFGMDLISKCDGVWPHPNCRFHMSLFRFCRPLYEVLEHCAQHDRDLEG